MTMINEPDNSYPRRIEPGPPCGPQYGSFVDAIREFQDTAAMVAAPDGALEAIELQLRAMTSTLQAWQTSEWERSAGQCYELPGRGHPLLPPVRIHQSGKSGLRGTVTLSPYFLGGNGAAHGGAVALLFDEVVGIFVNECRRDGIADLPHRTAYLTTNFRAITPVGVELRVECSIEREEGRKCFATGRLLHGNKVVADAEGLFVKLLPGMP